MTKLRDQGYDISITEFIAAKNMTAILDKMVPSGSNNNASEDTMDVAQQYVIEGLNHSHKAQVIE